MQRKSFLYLLAILALLVAMVPMGAAAQPAAPTSAAAESVGSEQLPTARDAKLILDGPTAPAAPPANPSAILFDNGPLTTHPGGGFGGANASAVQGTLGLTLFGFGHAISSGFRMADDFTVPAGGWNISTITFYAYQTGSTTTTTINNVNLQIWNGVPGVGSVVFGDTTTNRLAGSSFSNIYRVTDTALTGSTRPIMANVVTVNTTLPAGTYWLDWQTGGTLTSGPWAPPVSILGQTAKPGSNGLQYNPTTATWGPALDVTVQQDLPFVVEGATPQGPAISLNKTVGTTPGVCAAGDNITVTAGTQVYYCYQATNTGTVAFNFHDLVDSELGTILDNFPYALAPGASSPQVIVPDTPMATVTNVGTWTAVSALAGYTADDTIPYNWQDISGTGTAVTLTDDSVSGALPMGFSFDFFGTGYTDAYASSNGFMTFASGSGNGCCTGQALPNPSAPNNLIAGWWEDLNPSGGGTVHYQTLGTAPNRVFILQFTNIPHYPSGNPVTMQYKLFETTNVIEVHYQAAPSDGGTHSAGIENADGTVGVQYSYGTAALTTPEAVRYAPTPVAYGDRHRHGHGDRAHPQHRREPAQPEQHAARQHVDHPADDGGQHRPGQPELADRRGARRPDRPHRSAAAMPSWRRRVRRQGAPDSPPAQLPSCPTGVRLRPCSTTTARWSPTPVQAQAAPTPAHCRPRSASAPTASATRPRPATASPTTSRSAAPAG